MTCHDLFAVPPAWTARLPSVGETSLPTAHERNPTISRADVKQPVHDGRQRQACLSTLARSIHQGRTRARLTAEPLRTRSTTDDNR